MRRLHALLRLRRHQETRADSALGDATRARTQAETLHDELLRSDAIISSAPQPRALPELLALRMQGMAWQEDVAAAADAAARRLREEADARMARIEAATRRRSVQRAVERRDYEQALAAQRAARRALAELAMLQAVQR